MHLSFDLQSAYRCHPFVFYSKFVYTVSDLPNIRIRGTSINHRTLRDVFLRANVSKLCSFYFFRTAYVQDVVEDLLNLYSKFTHFSSLQLMYWRNNFCM